MDMNHPPTMGDWKEEKTLGSGGFGVVVLWRNTVLIINHTSDLLLKDN